MPVKRKRGRDCASSPKMKRHGNGGRGGRHDSDRRRGAFTKLVRDTSALVRNYHDAKRFVDGMATFDSKADLLTQLADSRYCGLRRLQDVIGFTDSTERVEELLIPMLQNLVNEETDRPLFRILRNRVLRAVYDVPGLLDFLVNGQIVKRLKVESANCLNRFLLISAKAFIEARQSAGVTRLAIALRERCDVVGASVLCSVVLADENLGRAQSSKGNDSIPSTAACWGSDVVPPGERHDNDHLNYRDVQLVPTAAELSCQMRAFLPLETGENAFLKDADLQLLDRNFRLLREDAVISMRENIHSPRHVWKNARVVGFDLSEIGRSRNVSFVIQLEGRSGTTVDWKKSRRLQFGSVVALCEGGTPRRLGTITVRNDDVPGEWLRAPKGPKVGVSFFSDGDFEDSIAELIHNLPLDEELHKNVGATAGAKSVSCNWTLSRMIVFDLVEVSGSFFAYQPILRCLQQMESVPLAEELVGSEPSGLLDYLPDEMRMPAGFQEHVFQLSNPESSSSACQSTTLDKSQADALLHAFSNRVALIQGPPGCGKTFIGTLIAQMILENTPESIVCVCYTNHALDQFLAHMVEAGETRVVRIGGRSKSEALERYQLKLLSRTKTDRDHDGSRRIRQVDALIHEQRDEISGLLKTITTPIGWTSPNGGFKTLLQESYPGIYQHLSIPDQSAGFHLVGFGGKDIGDDYLWRAWSHGKGFPDWMTAQFDGVIDEAFAAFWSKPQENRLQEIQTWTTELLDFEIRRLGECADAITTLLGEKSCLVQERDLQVLRQARVIGVTTTGAAKYNDILSASGAGVVIVEEAGEVLESHVLSSLTPETKHLILIGDHKQLRPKVESYELTTVSRNGYNLDRSLFERLVMSELPSVSLEVQHRMRPTISEFVRTQTYPFLQDHESVRHYPNVHGVGNDVVFIDHDHPEDGDGEEVTTKSNHHEAELCIELVRYFLLQGYRTEQVVVLTPYLGQLWRILDLVRSRLKDVSSLVSERDQADLEEADLTGVNLPTGPRQKSVRCSSIDNFQGEEADIIIASLVRSNKKGDIGFMKEAQRVNVLLSRARHGMFLVGNSRTFGRFPAWEMVLRMMKGAGQLVRGLPTTCQLHPRDEAIELCKPQDFRSIRPNGGCHRPCQYRLPCGHVCPLMCHPVDQDHVLAQAQCCEPCRRFPPECGFGHGCAKLCKEDCGPCATNVGRKVLVCGHTAENVRCHDVRSPEALALLSARCHVEVEHTFTPCSHTAKTTCANKESGTPRCPMPCGQVLACGHPCKNMCSTCKGVHRCGSPCSRELFCGHECGRTCHMPDPCPPCRKSCCNSCSHSKCPEKCSKPCASCVEKCDWQCEHQGRCALVCGAPCSRLPCNERCSKTLKCGHRCPSLCGEDCPDKYYCQQCASHNFRERVVDLICMAKYEEQNLDEDPIVVLSCGHFYATSTLDGQVALGEVYSHNATSGVFTGLKSLGEANVNEKPRRCPDCRAPIANIRRYGRLLRLTELRALERKHMMSVERSLQVLSKNTDGVNAVEHLDRVLGTIKRSPMRIVYEACGGSVDVEVPSPPSGPLIRCIQLKATIYAKRASRKDDESYATAEKAYEEAFAVAFKSKSFRSASMLRLELVKLYIKFEQDFAMLKSRADPLVDWVLQNATRHVDVVEAARALKDKMRKDFRKEEVKEVLLAMYNNEAGASSHWYECPNGHPYFIGECGGAMQESICIECGEVVGGTSHSLRPSNRTAGGLVGQVLRGN